MSQRLALVILSAGALGYPVAFAMVAQLRLWLGRRGGWPAILLNALVFLILMLALLFSISLASNLGLLRHLPVPARLGIAYGTAGALSIAPWGLALALFLWRRETDRGDHEHR
jgi:hypothetical protein